MNQSGLVEREHLQLLPTRVGGLSLSQLLHIGKVLVFPTAKHGENIGWPLTVSSPSDCLRYPLAGRFPRAFGFEPDQFLRLIVQVDRDLAHIITIIRNSTPF